MDLNTLLALTMQQITHFMGAEHSTLFLYDENKQMLWSRMQQRHDREHHPPSLSSDLQKKWVNICGITGRVMQQGQSVLCNDVTENNYFNPVIDSDNQHSTRTLLCVPLFDPKKYQIGVVQVINKRKGLFTQSDELLMKALCFQIAIAIENARLYEHISHLRDNETDLSSTLKQQNEQLQTAYQQLTNSNNDLTVALRKVKINRRISWLFLMVFVVVLGGIFGLQDSLMQQINSKPTQSENNPVYYFETIKPQYMRASILLSGFITPLEVVEVISPFNGKIKARYFHGHQQVKEGDLLLELDTTEEEIRSQEAEANLIKATHKLDILKDWNNSADVINAERHLHQLQLEKDDLNTKVQENKRLFNMGIIAETEYRSSRQALKTHELERQTAKQSLRLIRRKGQGENLHIAKLERNNAKLQLKAIKQRLKNAKIVANVNGVIMPVKSENQHQHNIVTGKPVNQGDVLFSIGNMVGIAVETNVDEVDISKIHQGQKVLLSGEAFPDLKLIGKVNNISSQASNEYGKVPFFNVRVTVPQLTKKQRQKLLSGMSATLEVLTYENQRALILPLSAVYQETGYWWVKRQTPEGLLQTTKVTLGINNETSVEILKGLKFGDKIHLPMKEFSPYSED